MLVQLLPSQVEKFWDNIKPLIMASLPPMIEVNGVKELNILQSILQGDMQCWFGYDEEKKLKLVILTGLVVDGISGTINMMIYALTGADNGVVPFPMFPDALVTLQGFARKNRCEKIIAFTNQERIVTLAGRLGATTNYSLLEFEVN